MAVNWANYPSKGTWQFRNQTRGFNFWPMLDSIDISQDHPEGVATFSCEVEDRNATLVFANEDHCWVEFRGTRIWSGHIKVPGEGALDEVGPRKWKLEGQDYTAKLDDSLIRRRQPRAKEGARRRINWILSHLRWNLAGTIIDIPAGLDVEQYDYFGASVREGLQHVADELRLFFYVDLNNVLHIFRDEVITPPFNVSNVSPDFITAFPLTEWDYGPDSVALANAILVEPEKREDSLWVTDAASIAAYTRQERFLSDESIKGPVGAQKHGNRAIAQYAFPEAEGTFVCWEPGLRAGMRIHVREFHFNHDEDFIIKSVKISAVEPHNDGTSTGTAKLHTLVTITKRRPPRGVSGRTPPSDETDTDPTPIDDFPVDVAPPTIVPDVAVPGAFGNKIAIRKGVNRDEITQMGPELFGLGAGAVTGFGSWIGEWYIGANSFRGWVETEDWTFWVMPAHPANMAGIRFSATVFNPTGYAAVGAFEVVVKTGAPTDVRQGTVVGIIPGNGAAHTLDIPGALVPPEGQSIYVGVRPAWSADYGARVEGYFNWPYNSTASQFDTLGVYYGGRSGRALKTLASALWLVFSVTGGSLGTTSGTGHSYRDAGGFGSPTVGVDEGALFLTATAASGRGRYLVGYREDETQPNAPWSDGYWGVEVDFSITAAGSLTEPGTREIEFTTIGQGIKTVGKVHLGDTSHAAGVSVAAPSAEVFKAVSILADGRYRALFDARNGFEMRGRLWKLITAQPANIAVKTPLQETEDNLDRFMIWLRGGNVGAGAQTIKVHGYRSLPGVRSGTRVKRELIGRADGVTKRFYAGHRFRKGSFRFLVNGASVRPMLEDGEATWAELDWWPTAKSLIRCQYQVA